MWIIYSVLSACFAALMTVFIKKGLKNINPILGLSIRTVIVSIICITVSLFMKSTKDIKLMNSKSWLWMILTSVFTFFTWFFYYQALNKGSVSKVMAIDKLSIVFTVLISVMFLSEKLSVLSIIGIILIIIGCVMAVF